MRVYKISNDVNRYQYFHPQDVGDIEKLQGECRPWGDSWAPPPVYIFRPLNAAGDFYQFASSVLITTPRATEALRGHLEAAGELLPLPFEGREFTLLNVLQCTNSLDHEHCEWLLTPEGRRLYLTRYAFHPDRFGGSTLFKIPETHRSQVLVVEGLRAPEGEFRYAVERAGLKGLVFEELWSDEG